VAHGTSPTSGLIGWKRLPREARPRRDLATPAGTRLRPCHQGPRLRRQHRL